MLMPSSLDKDEKWLKGESSWQAQAYSYVFYLSLEYRSPYYKEGCNMVILRKTMCFLNGDVGITGLVILNFGKQIIISLSCLPSTLLSSLIVLPLHIL
jgi:hypothetical protein